VVDNGEVWHYFLKASPAGRRIWPMQIVCFNPFAPGLGQKMHRGLACLASVHIGATHLVRRWPFLSVSANWPALPNFSKLAQPNLENTYKLQANKWKTHANAFLARPTSGQFIRNVQNEAISYNMSKKGKLFM
jgi:hypothetical protein